MWYKLISTDVTRNPTGFAEYSCKIQKKIRWKKVDMPEKVFFDIYDRDANTKVYDWSCTIDKNWIALGYKNRNKIKKILNKHFKNKHSIGNFRDTLKKV